MTASNSPAGETTSKSAARSDEPDTVEKKWASARRQHDLSCHAISSHLVGQAVCDRIDSATRRSCPRISGATVIPKACASAPPPNRRHRQARAGNSSTPARNTAARKDSAAVVNGFTGSSIWHALYAFPPTNQAYLEEGLRRLCGDAACPSSMPSKRRMWISPSKCIPPKSPSILRPPARPRRR